MARLDADLQLKAGTSLVPGRPADDALLSLLASMACSDGEVHEQELSFLAKIRSDLGAEELRSWALEHSGSIPLANLGTVITQPDDQWKTLRFAARMAWKDGELAVEERDMLTSLAVSLGLPLSAVERVLREMSPDDGTRYTSDRILQHLVAIHWDAVQLASGELCSDDLQAVLPANQEIVARVGLEKVEVLAVCTGGVVARFQEGAAFLGWDDLVTYTHGGGIGSSLRLHTEDGRSFTLVDQRLSGLGTFLDHLLDGEQGVRGVAPNVRHVRGED